MPSLFLGTNLTLNLQLDILTLTLIKEGIEMKKLIKKRKVINENEAGEIDKDSFSYQFCLEAWGKQELIDEVKMLRRINLNLTSDLEFTGRKNRELSKKQVKSDVDLSWELHFARGGRDMGQ